MMLQISNFESKDMYTDTKEKNPVIKVGRGYKQEIIV